MYFENKSQFVENKRDCSSKILDIYSEGTRFVTRLVYRRANNRNITLICIYFQFCILY